MEVVLASPVTGSIATNICSSINQGRSTWWCDGRSTSWCNCSLSRSCWFGYFRNFRFGLDSDFDTASTAAFEWVVRVCVDGDVGGRMGGTVPSFIEKACWVLVQLHIYLRCGFARVTRTTYSVTSLALISTVRQARMDTKPRKRIVVFDMKVSSQQYMNGSSWA